MSGRGKSSNYARGIKAENKVAASYRANGWSVKQSPGSRGAADLKCTSKSGTTHYVQVKSSHSGTARIASSEVGRLKSTATRNGATAVIAKVDPGQFNIAYAKTGSSVKL